MVDPQLPRLIEQDHEALRSFMSGDSGPKKALYSHRDDVTLANPLGPPALGWAAVSARLDQAAATLRGARSVDFEGVVLVESADMAYAIELEHYRDQRIAESDDPHAIDLRVTTIFRREDGTWRIVHRHADPIVTARGIETAVRPD